MIKYCSLCSKSFNFCPRCEGPVLIEPILFTMPDLKIKSTSVFVCITENCPGYAEFRFQTVEGIDTDKTFTCNECIKELEIFDDTEYS